MEAVATRPAIHFIAESLATAWDDARPLMESAHAEVGLKTGARFDPNRDLFAVMEKAGSLRAYTMRSDSCELRGFGLFGLSPHPFYPELLAASSFAFYVQPGARFQSVRFLDWTDEQLVSEGARLIARQVRPNRNYGRLLLSRGYELCESSFIWRAA